MKNHEHGHECPCDECQKWRNSFDWHNHSRTGKYTGIRFRHPIPRGDKGGRAPRGPDGIANLNARNDEEFETLHNSSFLYGERLCQETDENRAFQSLEALARRCYYGDVNETHAGYKACLQFLFGRSCMHEPYLIIHARHAEKYVVDYEKDGVKNRIYSPFEFRVVYRNKAAVPEMRRKRNIYLVFLEPANNIRPYDVNMTGATAQAWRKNKNNPRVWELYDLIYASDDEDDYDADLYRDSDDPYKEDTAPRDTDSDDESRPSDSHPLFDEWLFGEVPENNPNGDSFDLYEELETIHNKLREYVLAGKYPAEDYGTNIEEVWIPDWMLSEKFIFNMPPFTYSDRENYGVPYVVMPDFRWNIPWHEYIRQSYDMRPLNYLPPSIAHIEGDKRLYNERPWTIIDKDVYANGKARYPTEEETRLVRSARVHADALDDCGWKRNIYRFVKLKHRADEWTDPIDPFEGYYASQWEMWHTSRR